ncbi:hypothetical protein AS156_00555 [Bradyrhizobium macuxiense]|uniref:Uncharacterized protein n=1 Tax=Bradyrhizobium macuxiense TaxID=1755647 RepID=A0A109JSB6_9BRAD|nr:hypothetical protein AS156_00555 [Bradyrhizobium macuxiense]
MMMVAALIMGVAIEPRPCRVKVGFVIPGRVLRANPEVVARDSGFDAGASPSDAQLRTGE